MPKKAVSKKQAKFFGSVKGGAVKAKGLTPKKAGEMLKGTKMKSLPKVAKAVKNVAKKTKK